MLIGEYLLQIGDKNRLAVPKKLRENLEGQMFITRGYERCLILVDKKRWLNLLNEINTNPLLSLNVRDTKRFILGGANELEPDSQGRFVLSEQLKSFADIKEKVIFLGVGEWIEIWDYDRWINKLNDLAENVSDLAEKISNK